MRLRSKRFLSVPKDRSEHRSQTDRRPALLPSILDRHRQYDDEVRVSPHYKQIKADHSPEHDASSSFLSISRKPSDLTKRAYHRLHRIIKPNVVAKCTESISLYESIKQRIRQEISDRYLQEQRQGMEMIHDRLMKIL